MGALAWLGRTVVLVLSLLATLSIIGSIAAIPSGSIEGRLGIERPRQDRIIPAPTNAPDRPRIAKPEMPQPRPGASQMVETFATPAQPPRDDLLRWLEPLTYAVIALAGMMAIAVLFLWRIAAALDARR